MLDCSTHIKENTFATNERNYINLILIVLSCMIPESHLIKPVVLTKQ